MTNGMKVLRSSVIALSLFAAIAGGVVLAPRTAEASVTVKQARVSTLAAALLQFEGATRWEAMTPAWRARRDGWMTRVRAAATPAQLAALTIEVETIMTWAAMYPQWRQQRPGWIASTRAAATDHDVAQALIALEGATTWSAMFEDRWRPARETWLASLRGI